MGRGVIAVDRVVAFVLGAGLVAAGAVGLGWRFDLIPDAPERLRFSWLPAATRTAWWPWATGAAGVLLVLLGLVWLIRHFRSRGVRRLRLAGSGHTGLLTADAKAAATAAGERLTQTAGVRSSSGRMVSDRGQLVAELNLTIEPTADLGTVQAAAEQTSHDLHRMVGRDDLHHRVQLHVARHEQTPARVR
ncbi:hypothetical protein [Kribbella pratensis]|jgi:hypothetical protein|uniref:Uncharacterized protein n=1 Tax=Kribbella pratensis TaxID=2512112 RepID=A0A4R8BWH3_9ACTN|nr:hypothetical protein [Kribbella pratensis]TDW66150.1 hypothetical protein EV653_6168 [Kribbella pratensis]